jgi:hypothetical protein
MITGACHHVVHVRLHTKLGIVSLEVFGTVVHCVEDRVDREFPKRIKNFDSPIEIEECE